MNQTAYSKKYRVKALTKIWNVEPFEEIRFNTLKCSTLTVRRNIYGCVYWALKIAILQVNQKSMRNVKNNYDYLGYF